MELSEKYLIPLGSAKEVLREAIEPVLSIFVRMTIDQIMAVTENTRLEELRKRPMPPLAVFNLQAEEGIAVENEIRGRQEGADNNEDYFPSVLDDF